MSYRSRDYAADGVQYRGHVHEVGERMTREHVWDETTEERDARVEAWRAANPTAPIWRCTERGRKGHYEDRGLQRFEHVRTYGPYKTIAPAKRSVSTGKDVRKVTETPRNEDGEWCTRTAEVHIGTVTWEIAE